MKKAFALAMFLSLFFLSPHAFSADTQYTIQDIWSYYPDPDEPFYPTISEAYGINDSGYVVGRLAIVPGIVEKPFLWKSGNFTPLPGAGTTYGGNAVDINNSNQFVGWALLPFESNPFDPGGPPYREKRGFFVDSDQTTTIINHFAPSTIDSAGAVYGSLAVGPPPDFIDATWKDGSFIPPAINPETDSHIQASTLTNLKDKLAPGYDPFWGELTPTDINSIGQIVGFGEYRYNDETFFNRAFIMTPIVTPEPASMALFGIGGAALAAASRRKNKK